MPQNFQVEVEGETFVVQVEKGLDEGGVFFEAGVVDGGVLGDAVVVRLGADGIATWRQGAQIRRLHAGVVDHASDGPATVEVSDGTNGYRVKVQDERQARLATLTRGNKPPGGGTIRALMPGKVVKILVGKGDAVKAGQPLLVLEAMKMENQLVASTDGVVADIPVAVGQSIESGAVVLSLDPHAQE